MPPYTRVAFPADRVGPGAMAEAARSLTPYTLSSSLSSASTLPSSPQDVMQASLSLAYFHPVSEATYAGKEHSYRTLARSPKVASRGIGGGLDWLKEPCGSGYTDKTGAAETELLKPLEREGQRAWQSEGNFPAGRR